MKFKKSRQSLSNFVVNFFIVLWSNLKETLFAFSVKKFVFDCKTALKKLSRKISDL